MIGPELFVRSEENALKFILRNGLFSIGGSSVTTEIQSSIFHQHSEARHRTLTNRLTPESIPASTPHKEYCVPWSHRRGGDKSNVCGGFQNSILDVPYHSTRTILARSKMG
ncbi:hypothetical protein JTE90_004571 [Oedothorax gibbosus]|uniref:Uncharacterized protein n=1 Tax=Oedothorax gibbosus TaxID=931172 RepID=A0AAV6UJE3_9ARAC|nr:hypothetical protein JTE90_004571 [Oedothorax gibbosus]